MGRRVEMTLDSEPVLSHVLLPVKTNTTAQKHAYTDTQVALASVLFTESYAIRFDIYKRGCKKATSDGPIHVFLP